MKCIFQAINVGPNERVRLKALAVERSIEDDVLPAKVFFNGERDTEIVCLIPRHPCCETFQEAGVKVLIPEQPGWFWLSGDQIRAVHFFDENE